MRRLAIAAALLLASCAPPTGPTPTPTPTPTARPTPTPYPTSDVPPPIGEELERRSWYTPTGYGLPTPEPTAALRGVFYYHADDAKHDKRNGRLVLVVGEIPYHVSIATRDHGEPTATLLRAVR